MGSDSDRCSGLGWVEAPGELMGTSAPGAYKCSLVLALHTQLFANESVPDHVGYAKVKITLINENDNRPIFSQPLYNVSLYENVTVGTSVLTVLVSPLSLAGQLSSGVNHQEASRGSLPKECGQLGERGEGYPQALRGCGVGVLEHLVSS